jgi:hypothetical protein
LIPVTVFVSEIFINNLLARSAEFEIVDRPGGSKRFELVALLMSLRVSILEYFEQADDPSWEEITLPQVGKNKRISKGKKGGKKKSQDPFARKDWYEVKAPTMFQNRSVGKTLVTRTTGTKVSYPDFCSRIEKKLFEESVQHALTIRNWPVCNQSLKESGTALCKMPVVIIYSSTRKRNASVDMQIQPPKQAACVDIPQVNNPASVIAATHRCANRRHQNAHEIYLQRSWALTTLTF